MADVDLNAVACKTRYPLDGFIFVQRGLDFTVRRTHGQDQAAAESSAAEADAEESESRHVTGQQLCQGLRDFAVDQYGLLARSVLRRWNITSCEDFGHIVFAMVESGLMRKTDGDRIEDFQNVFDFADAFAPSLSLTNKA